MAIGDDEWDGDWSVETADDIIAEEVDGKANARLIAAGPELYAALEAIVDRLDDEETGEPGLSARDFIRHWGEMQEAARAALAKARGEL